MEGPIRAVDVQKFAPKQAASPGLGFLTEQSGAEAQDQTAAEESLGTPGVGSAKPQVPMCPEL